MANAKILASQCSFWLENGGGVAPWLLWFRQKEKLTCITSLHLWEHDKIFVVLVFCWDLHSTMITRNIILKLNWNILFYMTDVLYITLLQHLKVKKETSHETDFQILTLSIQIKKKPPCHLPIVYCMILLTFRKCLMLFTECFVQKSEKIVVF